MSNDTDREDLVPDPDAPPAPGEQARADSFARLVDGLVAGQPLPPAMDSEDRALVEAATVVVASTRELELPADRRGALIDQALERAILGGGRASSTASDVAEEEESERTGTDSRVMSLSARRSERVFRVLPWAVASVAAAAAVFLFLSRQPIGTERVTAPVAAADGLGEVHRSRPADRLIGVIPESDGDHAAARLDAIYADRMAGYRDLYFRRKLGGAR